MRIKCYLHYGDGYNGLPTKAPFNKIIVDEIESKRERKLSIINKPQNGELYIDFTYENTT